MQAGMIRRRLGIEAGAPALVDGLPGMQWTSVGGCWGDITSKAAQGTFLELQHVVTTRWQSRLLSPASLRLTWRGRKLYVIGSTDPDNARRTLTLTCKEFEVFPLSATIQTATVARSSTGGTSYTWLADPTLTSIPCIRGDSHVVERRLAEMTEELSTFQFLLDGFYPQISASSRLVLDVTGETYDIIGPVSDVVRAFTTIQARQIEPVAAVGV